MRRPQKQQDAQARRRAAGKTFATQQVELLLLTVLIRRAATGADLQGELEVCAGGDFALPAGVIYPALYRLETAQLVAGRTLSADGRSIRLYEITEAGRAAYEERVIVWTRHAQKLHALIGAGRLTVI